MNTVSPYNLLSQMKIKKKVFAKICFKRNGEEENRPTSM